MKHRQSVYFASALDKIKIGCSSKPQDRILQVGEWIPFPITMLAMMPGTYVLESALHRMFAVEWSHGEWFHASDRLLAFIARVQAGLPVAIDDCALPEAENARRHAIAEKKRIARYRHILPPSLVKELDAVAPGAAIPDSLLCRVQAFARPTQTAA